MDIGERILLVDAHPESRRRLEADLRQAGLSTRAFSRPQVLFNPLTNTDRQEIGCLIIDPELLEPPPAAFLAQLRQAGWIQPAIFVGRRPVLAEVVAAIKAGAQDFFQEPVTAASLLAAVREALTRHRANLSALSRERLILARYQRLTAREREVMARVCEGRANKEIAREFGISPRTVENHRAHLMAKMQAHRVADLCAMAALCLPHSALSSVALDREAA